MNESLEIKEPCCVSDHGCESPLGWGGSFGIAVNTDLKLLQPCYVCGMAVCNKCSLTTEYFGQQQRLCRYCAEDYQKQRGTVQTFYTQEQSCSVE